MKFVSIWQRNVLNVLRLCSVPWLEYPLVSKPQHRDLGLTKAPESMITPFQVSLKPVAT